MSSKTSPKKQKPNQANPYEALKNASAPGFLDRVLGGSSRDDESSFMEQFLQKREAKKQKPAQRQEAQVFNYSEYHEKEMVRRQMSELTEQIKKEVGALKNTEASLMKEVHEVEAITINSLPEKPGVYHIRFMELVLSLIRTIRLKMGESKTWLDAMMSKKKKRGSLFATRSKKMGTQYSLSQELQSSRSVQ